MKFLLLVCILLAGCDQSALVRRYTETFGDAPKKVLPKSSMLSSMPQDDIHKGLTMPEGMPSGQMPQDDIHAGLTRQGMDMQDPALQKAINASADQTPLEWNTPKEWLEKKGSGLRLATFTGTQFKVETTIVSLGGSAGGVSANIARWMQQISLDVLEGKAMDDFIKGQEKFSTKSGLPVSLVDLTQLQESESGSVPSMIAAIIDRGDTQIFVKMTGSKEDVLKSRQVLKDFVQTIRLKE